MKCQFLNDTFTERDTLPASEQEKCVAKTEYHRDTGSPRVSWYFPAGTVLEHPDAWKFVNFGMATAADDECQEWIKPVTPERAAYMQKRYRAASLGIRGDVDLQLFMDDVIAGYEMVPNGQLAYLPGPKWDEWNATNKAKQAAKEDEI